ncbi:MAG: CinA family protein [Bacteroidaceae bacterium]|nr:CinA family protein [Bacteroidaceae bacterium]
MCRLGSIRELAAELVTLLAERSLTVATAESCTGGAIASAITKVPGCSDVMLGGVVAYHNDIKHRILGVSKDTLFRYGAVSEATVREMVVGVADRFGVSCAVATSGIAGPGGGTPEKPVGTVWVAVKVADRVDVRLLQLPDKGREANIENVVCEVLGMLKEMLQ